MSKIETYSLWLCRHGTPGQMVNTSHQWSTADCVRRALIKINATEGMQIRAAAISE